MIGLAMIVSAVWFFYPGSTGTEEYHSPLPRAQSIMEESPSDSRDAVENGRTGNGFTETGTADRELREDAVSESELPESAFSESEQQAQSGDTPDNQLPAISRSIPPINNENQQIKAFIITALNAKTPAVLLDIMPDRVLLERYGTDCCGIIERDQVGPEFARLEDAVVPWTFDQTAVSDNLLADDPDTFEDTIIAVSRDGQAVAFEVTETDLLDRVVLVE